MSRAARVDNGHVPRHGPLRAEVLLSTVAMVLVDSQAADYMLNTTTTRSSMSSALPLIHGHIDTCQTQYVG